MKKTWERMGPLDPEGELVEWRHVETGRQASFGRGQEGVEWDPNTGDWMEWLRVGPVSDTEVAWKFVKDGDILHFTRNLEDGTEFDPNVGDNVPAPEEPAQVNVPATQEATQEQDFTPKDAQCATCALRDDCEQPRNPFYQYRLKLGRYVSLKDELVQRFADAIEKTFPGWRDNAVATLTAHRAGVKWGADQVVDVLQDLGFDIDDQDAMALQLELQRRQIAVLRAAVESAEDDAIAGLSADLVDLGIK